jgi:hypothetical protein
MGGSRMRLETVLSYYIYVFVRDSIKLFVIRVQMIRKGDLDVPVTVMLSIRGRS